MDKSDKGRMMTMIGVSGWMFLLVPAHLGCLGQNPESRKAVVCECVWEKDVELRVQVSNRIQVSFHLVSPTNNIIYSHLEMKFAIL